MMALRSVDDTGEHQVIDPTLGGFRQSYELWVCHAQLPDVRLSDAELSALLTYPHACNLRTDDREESLTSRLDAARALSHLQWQWVPAPVERQLAGEPDRYEARATVQGAIAANVWFRPAARVTGWVRDETVPTEGAARAMTPVDAVGWYVTQASYRGERWVFATGESPEGARLAIDELVGDEVNKLRHLVADIDSRRAALSLEQAVQRRPRYQRAEPEDGWVTLPAERLEVAGLTLPTGELPVVFGDPRGAQRLEPLDERGAEWSAKRGQVVVEAPASQAAVDSGPPTGRAVVAWNASGPEQAGWRRLLTDTRERVTAWVSRIHWRRSG